jgi:hypothetical protein
MEKITVTATFDSQGNITPLAIERQGKSIQVLSTGREWLDKEGHHILVMLTENEVSHLVFAEGIWYLMPHERNRKMA